MAAHPTSRNRRSFIWLLILSWFALAPSVAQATDYVFIRNHRNGTAKVTRQEVRQLFTGQTKQWGGKVAQAVIGETDSGEFGYLAGLFGVLPRQLMEKIKQEVFRGEMRRPVVARTAAECIAAVEKHEGGIGVVTAEAAKALPPDVERIPMTD
jgi:hypothetical protein